MVSQNHCLVIAFACTQPSRMLTIIKHTHTNSTSYGLLKINFPKIEATQKDISVDLDSPRRELSVRGFGFVVTCLVISGMDFVCVATGDSMQL